MWGIEQCYFCGYINMYECRCGWIDRQIDRQVDRQTGREIECKRIDLSFYICDVIWLRNDILAKQSAVKNKNDVEVC